MPDPSDAWRRALSGDRDAFNEAISPYQDTLLDAARRQVEVQRQNGALATTDLTPEELTGETLIVAYDRRQSFDADAMSLRAFLLGIQARTLTRLTRAETRHDARTPISLDDPIPVGAEQDAVEEQFYEFRQPFDVETYGDYVPGAVAADASPVEQGTSDLTDDDDNPLGPTDGEAPNALTNDPLADRLGRAEQAMLLHDEFELSLAEVASIFDESLKDTAENMNLARAGLLARMGSEDDYSGDDPATDSYTGDPLPDA